MAQCIDCQAEGIPTNRPATYGGPRSPRCHTHYKQAQKARRATNHASRVKRVYGLTEDAYKAILAHQGGKCAICQRATGRTRRLSVDHEHNKPGCTHEPEHGCTQCIRGLACSQCNRIVLGRYNIEALTRAIHYLNHPPAQEVLRTA